MCLVVYSFSSTHCFTTESGPEMELTVNPSLVDGLCYKCARFNLLGLEIVGRVSPVTENDLLFYGSCRGFRPTFEK